MEGATEDVKGRPMVETGVVERGGEEGEEEGGGSSVRREEEEEEEGDEDPLPSFVILEGRKEAVVALERLEEEETVLDLFTTVTFFDCGVTFADLRKAREAEVCVVEIGIGDVKDDDEEDEEEDVEGGVDDDDDDDEEEEDKDNVGEEEAEEEAEDEEEEEEEEEGGGGKGSTRKRPQMIVKEEGRAEGLCSVQKEKISTRSQGTEPSIAAERKMSSISGSI